MATDWNAYSSKPGFSSKQRNRLTKIKGALKRGAGGAEKRLRREMRGLYGERRSALKQYESPLYGKGTYSQSQLDKVAISQTRGKYGQALGEVENDIGATTQRQAQIAKYYDDWIAETNNLRAQSAAAHQAAIDAQTQNAQKTQAAEGQANTQAGQRMAADAAARGQTFDPSAITKANQASAARATTSNAQSTHLAAAKNAYDNFYGQQGLITTGAKGSQLQREGKYTQTLKDKLLDLRREAGDFAASRKSELDQQQYDRYTTSQALGLKNKQFAHDVRMDQAGLEIDRQNADTSRINATTGDSSGGGSAPASGPTRSQTSQARRAYLNFRDDTASEAFRSGRLKKGSADGWARRASKKYGIDYKLARAAAMEKVYGGVDAKTRKEIKDTYGIVLRLSKSAKKKR